MTPGVQYRGRFAPSPTGPLHFGSLVAAVGSYLDAKSRGGEWLVRIEDIDIPRNAPGAADRILRTLERYALEWDGPVVYQTSRFGTYGQVLESLKHAGTAFPCGCTRREAGEGPYPGICRDGLPPGRGARAWRLRTGTEPIRFRDRRLGECTERLSETCGDFVLFRADGYWAYQLAVVVDDAWQGITDIVRGEDLLDSTARQICLQRALGVPTPSYLHLPIARDANGDKLSKQTKAPALDEEHPAPELVRAMRFLGLDPPETGELRALWKWGISAWKQE